MVVVVRRRRMEVLLLCCRLQQRVVVEEVEGRRRIDLERKEGWVARRDRGARVMVAVRRLCCRCCEDR